MRRRRIREESRIAIFLLKGIRHESLKRKSLIAMSFARDDRDRARVSKYYFPPDRASSPVTFTRSTRIACAATCVCASNTYTNVYEFGGTTERDTILARIAPKFAPSRIRRSRQTARFKLTLPFFPFVNNLSYFNFVF